MPRRKPSFEPVDTDDRSIEQTSVARLFVLENAPRPVLRDLILERIEPNPFQARQTFPDLEELADVIRVQGFTSRLRVRSHPTKENYFQLVYGERRLRAAALAGLTEVPVEVVEHSDLEMIEIGLAENIQRRDLDPLEEARALRSLMDAHGYSQRQLAERLGKTHGYIQRRLDLLRAPEDVQEMVAARPDTLGAARVLQRLDDPDDRRYLVARVLDGSLTGETAAREAQALINRSPSSNPSPDVAPTQRLTQPSSTTSAEMQRVLGRDANRLMSTVIRWNKALATATPADERAFAAYLREGLLPELEAVLRSADDRAGGAT